MLNQHFWAVIFILHIWITTQDVACLQIRHIHGHTENYDSTGHDLAPGTLEGYKLQLPHCVKILRDKCWKEVVEYIFHERPDLCKECYGQHNTQNKLGNKQLIDEPVHKDFDIWYRYKRKTVK